MAERKDPLEAFRFRISIKSTVMGFSSVSGISFEVETEAFREGGLNDRVHLLVKPSSGERVLHLEKGAYAGNSHPFYLVGEPIGFPLVLEVLNGEGGIAKKYTFSGVLVKKWEAGSFDAMQNSILIEKFDLSYEMVEIDK